MPHGLRRVWTGSRGPLIASGLSLCLASGCATTDDSSPAESAASTPAPETIERQRARVLEAVVRYKRQHADWITGPAIVPQLSLMPPAEPRYGGPEDNWPHPTLSHGGRKVSHLYASDAEAYDAHVRDESPVEPGFFLVKESWHARETDAPMERATPAAARAQRERAVRAPDGRLYLPDEPYGLFVMLKEPADAPNTDRGWIYATASFDGREVLEVGRIASCMHCHEHAPHDRLYGPARAELPPRPRGARPAGG